MRAALLQAYASAPVVGSRPAPEGATVVAVSVAPVVPLDLLCASGTSYLGEPALPYVPGVQGVGRVVRSPALEAGTRVWFATSAGMAPGDGSLAETCAVAAGRRRAVGRGRGRRGRGGDRDVRDRGVDVPDLAGRVAAG